MAETIVIEGLKELSDRLATLPAKAAKRYLSKCAEPAATVVLDAMAATVPVGIGILEEELDWQKKWLNGDETTMVIKVGPLKPAFWGSFQEFGTRFQAGQHWMSRAWESCKDQCLDVFVIKAQELLKDLEHKG